MEAVGTVFSFRCSGNNQWNIGVNNMRNLV